MNRETPFQTLVLNSEWQGMKLGLHRIKGVLKKLTNPEKKFPHVLIGGTNGKGSVAYNVCRQFGPKAGLFLSPHLVNIRERITLCGAWIEDAHWQKAEARLLATGLAQDLSYFEIMLVIAVLMFSELSVPFAVFEVGLGGRFDATNGLQPDASMITNVSLDHQKILGDTVDAIALEKIEIARPGKPFYLPASLLAMERVKTRLESLGCILKPQPDADDMRGNERLVKTFCKALGFWCEDQRMAMLPGRREVLADGRILLDGAHNPASWRAMVDWLVHKGISEIDMVVGLTEGRKPNVFLETVAPVCRSLRVWNGWSVRELPTKAWPTHINHIREPILPSVETEPLVVCGSLYMVGAYREWLTKQGLAPTVEQIMRGTLLHQPSLGDITIKR